MCPINLPWTPYRREFAVANPRNHKPIQPVLPTICISPPKTHSKQPRRFLPLRSALIATHVELNPIRSRQTDVAWTIHRPNHLDYLGRKHENYSRWSSRSMRHRHHSKMLSNPPRCANFHWLRTWPAQSATEIPECDGTVWITEIKDVWNKVTSVYKRMVKIN